MRESAWQGQGAVYWTAFSLAWLGFLCTALYTFRLFFLVFHGKERMDAEARAHLHETPPVVTVPLILLAIPAAIIGWYTVGPVLFGDYFGDAIFVSESHDVIGRMAGAWHGSLVLLTHPVQTSVFWLAAAGVLSAWFLYLKRPDIPEKIKNRVTGLYDLLDHKYYFDDLWIKGFAAGG